MLLFFGALENWSGIVNSAIMTLKEAGQDFSQTFRESMPFLSCIVRSAANKTCFKIN
jgi:hypothetical protein